MQFLRTAFWVALAVLLVLFAMNNWTRVQVTLWGGLVMDTTLPVLLGIAFALGAVPMWVALRATRWRMKRRVETAERALANAVPPLVAAPSSPVIAGDI